MSAAPPDHHLPGLFVGLTTVDLSYRVPRVPGANQKLQASRQSLAAGGPAANAAVAFAREGGAPRLVTALGSHPLALAAVADLSQAGVRVHDCLPGRTEPPGISSIMVNGAGDRAVVSAGAAGMTPDSPAEMDAWVAASRVVLVDGHHVDLALDAVTSARRHRVPVVLDGGSWKPVTPELLPLADVAVVSADFVPPDLRPGQDLLSYLLVHGARFAAVTDGPNPVRWSGGDSSGSLSVPAVEVADTTAAGDVLHGVLAWYVARSGTSTAALVSALERSIAAASGFVSAFGTRSWP